MKLENTFTVPTGIEQAWEAFNDPRRFAPCFPGATLDSSDADSFTGTVKVKLGPISLSYKGKGTYVERDEASHTVLIDASGRDSRGNGTASAKVTGSLAADGPDRTTVTMVTDMTVTGRPAQFGRGVMADVSDKIIAQFASCLSKKLGPDPDPTASASPPSGSASPPSGSASPTSGSASPTSGSASSGASATPSTGSVAGAPGLAETVGAVSTAPPASSGPETNGSGPKLVSGPMTSEVEAIDLLGSAGAPVIKRLVPVFIALVLLFIVLRRIKHR